jgi:hypothetical protein
LEDDWTMQGAGIVPHALVSMVFRTKGGSAWFLMIKPDFWRSLLLFQSDVVVHKKWIHPETAETNEEFVTTDEFICDFTFCFPLHNMALEHSTLSPHSDSQNVVKWRKNNWVRLAN